MIKNDEFKEFKHQTEVLSKDKYGQLVSLLIQISRLK
jgi:hypothetical protein